MHIRRAGNWTNDLAKECHVDELEFKEAWKQPKYVIVLLVIRIDMVHI